MRLVEKVVADGQAFAGAMTGALDDLAAHLDADEFVLTSSARITPRASPFPAAPQAAVPRAVSNDMARLFPFKIETVA